jgi:tetratricopeptide (TPR) repeat protein/predicted Ser/Thr protein kinase
MQCPLCQADNPPTAEHCTKCSTPLPLADMTLSPTAMGTAVSTQAWSVAVTPRPSSEAAAKGQLEPGTLLAERFEILQLLGQGGMGAVYKARDTELERLVALKLIRPELASHPEILRRFKQELILAREVTHRNVIRIFDLGQAQGIKFITMEYVEGRDLKGQIHEKGKFTAEEAVPIVLQIAAALEAAHTAGVVHRDLKPQNVMSDKDGRVYVMDFGIARSLEHQGMTQTGALMGTPEYMSPEQAKGEKVDARSDLFALGIIFYEMLTGISPFKAETAMAMMFKRTQERATPLSQLNLGVPPVISDIVSKCLETKAEERYQSAREVITDLEAWKGGVPHSTIVPTSRRIRYAPSYQKWLVVGGVAIVLAGGVYVFREKFTLRPSGSSAAPAQALSLAILPFRNTSADSSIDWIGATLSDMLSTDVGQSARLRTVSSDRLHQILKDLRIPPNSDFDPDALRHLQEFSNADILVSGTFAKFGDQIRIDAILHDYRHDRQVPLKIEAPNEKAIPATVDQFADLIRKNLAVSSDVLQELKASSFQPISQSVTALRDYNQGLQLVRDGKNLDAIKALQDAVKEDPQFALAYSRLAEANATLGYDTDAEKYSRQAMDLRQQLPIAEKYLIEASHAKVMKDDKKAIEAYENLAKTLPDSGDVEEPLGALYMEIGDYDKARAQFAKILSSDPKNIKALWQMGMVEIKKENPQGALDPLNKGISLAVQVDNKEQKAQLLQALGIAYRLMNKPEEAIKSFNDSMEINRALGFKRLLANNLEQMGQAQDSLGKPDQALASMAEALKIQREIGAKKELGDTLLSMGVVYYEQSHYDKALESYKASLQIQREIGDQKDESLCLNNIGAAYLAKGDNDNAFTYLQQSLQLREKLNIPRDIADSLDGLGQTYRATGQYDQALASFLKAMDLYRKIGDERSAAGESHQMGLVFGYQGRVGAAVSALQDTVKPIQGLSERDPDIALAWNDLGDALTRAGRGAEAGKPLGDALGMAQDFKSDGLLSQVFNSQGNVKFFAGDYAGAKALYDQALRLASKGTSRDNILIPKLNLAKVAIAEGRSQSVINDLRALSQEADRLGRKNLALESSVDMAAAMVNAKDYIHARQELERVLGVSERLGARLQTARIHYLLGTIARLTEPNGAAARQYTQALKQLDDIKKEAGAEHVLDRVDLKAIYDDATHWSQGAKS